jgi:hypothetical protein
MEHIMMLALIIPLGDRDGLSAVQLPALGGMGHPSHPIAPGGPGISHPIAPGGSPGVPGHLPALQPPHVDNTLPPITPPTQGPGSPSHPIALPPDMWPPAGAVTPPIHLPNLPPVVVVWAPGHGHKVIHVQPPPTQPLPPTPPGAQPKPA